MKATVGVLCIFVSLISTTYQQVPGVNPNHYQQQQVPQPPSSSHQQPQQDAGYQQPQHGGSQHQPHYQQPQTAEGQYVHKFGQEEVHDAEHIKEHLKEVVDKPKEQMTDEELEFHYFKLHDYDNNNKLDGTEITKAITHFHSEEDEKKEGDQSNKENVKVITDEEITNIVDLVLKEDDLNNDGYIEYVEFIAAQRKARGN
ncbi:hypothetical protein CHS0354_004053 [Potamilus streckersoni]|uniref:EF-hand domain-containing protein n=1 Tax=Potamilus streckersoni TaxID=2493646 RepID=A0AAE0T7Y3_9BIVA|nr:hypothetical protein CHS0354_004053 [Potamilus streckersoni]